MDKASFFINNLYSFIFETIPVGIIVYNRTCNTIFCNKKAQKITTKYDLPPDVENVVRRMIHATRHPNPSETLPGDIVFTRTLEGSPSKWTFHLHMIDGLDPCVCVYMYEETASSKFNLDTIRSQYKLTRRENDVLRRVLDGLKNIEIADELCLSEQTVKDYLSSIYSKIGVQRKSSLISHLMNSSGS